MPDFALRQGGERVLANVYRLIDIARRSRSTTRTSFRALLNTRKTSPLGARQQKTPLLERKTSGVTLMTAHKSKALNSLS